MEIVFRAEADVRALIAELGRTEDVRFSPSGNRLAIAGFARNKIIVLSLEIDLAGPVRQVRLNTAFELTSRALAQPHGLDFIDEATLIVANRAGNVTIFKLPPTDSQRRSFELDPCLVLTAGPLQAVASPGSVAIVRKGPREFDALIANTYADRITRHRFAERQEILLEDSKTLLTKWLETPDGVSVSPSGWIAVSSHDRHQVLIYDGALELTSQTDPIGVLAAVSYPHGVRFTRDGRFILLADAGAPFVHIFAAAGGDWRGVRKPSRSLRVMSERMFLAGRIEPREGGPKGLDIHPKHDLVATTCSQAPLRFLDLPTMLEGIEPASLAIQPTPTIAMELERSAKRR